ncbi:oxidoreductase [Polychaeton citri CBS 116435]|uniref:Oxidoreductase n=1 Tax=Polychaeton citri CBS 116435 TaxID=1314669 RepID=A0A9P4Q9I4_9PEZI|nr:oxidoreductase [Polychaeton citri CBS 116435]
MSDSADHQQQFKPQSIPLHHTESLETCIRQRHSIRFFKPDPVPASLLSSCLQLAQLAPSNSNIQNWRLTFAQNAARDRIIASLFEAATQHGPNVPPLPEAYRHFRSEMGRELYGPQGYDIAREDKDAHKAATMRNFRFFDAPLIGVITMDRGLSSVDSMSVGMFVQTFMLALTEQGLGACLQVSVTGYPEVLKEGFGLGDDQLLLCGIAVGWPQEKNKVNELVMKREDLAHEIKILEE